LFDIRRKGLKTNQASLAFRSWPMPRKSAYLKHMDGWPILL